MYPTNTVGYIALYCDSFILLTQIIHKVKHKSKTSLILQYSTLNSTVSTAYMGWLWVNRQEELLLQPARLEEEVEVGDGRAKRLLAVGVGGNYNCTWVWYWWQRFSFLAGFCSNYSLKQSSDVWVVALCSHHRWHGSTELHSEQLLQPSCTVLCLRPVPQKLTVLPQIQKSP